MIFNSSIFVFLLFVDCHVLFFNNLNENKIRKTGYADQKYDTICLFVSRKYQRLHNVLMNTEVLIDEQFPRVICFDY